MFVLFIILFKLSILCLGLLKVIVYWSLFDDSMCLVKVPDLREVGEEVSPHHVVLVYVCTLDLAHCDEMICQEKTVVIAYTSYFSEALV